MIDRLRRWRELRRAERNLNCATRAQAKLLKAAGRAGNGQRVRELNEEFRPEYFLQMDIIQDIKTRGLVVQANKLDIPIPRHDDDEMWEDASTLGTRSLTTRGFAHLRSEVRRERNERWQYWELRLKMTTALLTGATGVIGALIGWAAIAG